MRLYVLNATGQNLVFTYRLDYLVDDEGRRMVGTAKPYRHFDIKARAQMPLGGDWDPVQMKNIVEQLEAIAVGGVHVSNIKTAKAEGLVRLVWSQDKPIPRAICEDVYQHNILFLSHDGERRRSQMAVANSLSADQANGAVSREFAIEVETVDQSADSPSPSLNAGYRVNKQRSSDDAKPKGRTRKTARG